MAIEGKNFKLTATERDPHSFEYASGRHRLLMSKTMESDLPTTWFSPVDLLLSGIAGCLGMVIRTKMEEAGFDFEDLRLEIEGIRPDGADRVGLKSISTTVHIKTSADPAKVREIVEKSEESCTVRNTLEFTPDFSLKVVLES